MPNRLQNRCTQLLHRAELLWRRVTRSIAIRRIERLYGDLPRQTMPAPISLEAQVHRLTGIVRQHCNRSGEILAAHDSATIKLDAAEYAFSAMLEELRGTMKSRPSAWMQERMAPAILLDQSVAGQKARVAA